MRLSTEQQAEYHALAAAGDRAAANILAASCLMFIRRKAQFYAKRLGLHADDLESVGQSTFVDCVKYYNREHGTFINYYSSAAIRAMCRYSRRVMDERARTQHDDKTLESQAYEHNFAQLDLTAGLAGLDPLQLALVRAARTPDDPNLITEAHRLGLRVPRARLKFQEAFDQVAKNLGVT